MIFDSHAHYDDEAFTEDRDRLLNSLQEQGITAVMNVGASLGSTKTSIALAEAYDFIYAAAGVHPSETEELDEQSFLWLKEQCAHEKVLAVGEIGLDYYWPEPDRDLQKKWFERQLALAEEVGLPVIIHSRDAAKDTLDIMQKMHAEKIGGVIHCFSYEKEMAKIYVDMGFYIGIGGVLTFKNARKTREVVESIPLERIVLETDSPYLAPVPNRGKRNDSRNLPYVVTEIAKIKNISEEEVMEVTMANAKRLYRISD